MNILFLCVANSARSQIAEGLAREILGSGFGIQSAGSKPSYVSPQAVDVMKELNIDISSQTSKSVETIDAVSIDIVITLCKEEVCPIFLNAKKRIHWGLPDPARIPISDLDARLAEFRHIRDEIKKRLLALKEELSNGIIY